MSIQTDRHFDVPTEANRDNHFNYLSKDRGEKDPATDESGNLFENNTRRGCDEEKDPREYKSF
jgi:hypothetical protein